MARAERAPASAPKSWRFQLILRHGAGRRKDVHADTPKARLEVRALGAGDLAGALEPMAAGLRAMDYSGAISLESVHHFGDGIFEAGFRGSVDAFRRIFGAG